MYNFYDVEENTNFSAIFVLVSFFIFNLCQLIYQCKRKESLRLFGDINIVTELKKPTKFILAFSNANGCEEEVEEFYNVQKYYDIGDELKEIGYKGFNMSNLNLAHRNICKKILKSDFCCMAILQNMKNPRDFYDLYCYILMNDMDYNISVKIFTKDGVKFLQREYYLENVIKDGGQMRYGKGNRKLDKSLKKVDDCIFVEKEEKLEYIKEVKNEYFRIKLYKGSETYGVEVLENNLGIEDSELWYVGQYYVLI